MTKTVAAAPADAFYVVANFVEWPLITRSVKGVEVLTPGRIRAGTRLREHRVMFGAEGSHELEVATSIASAAFACSSSIPVSTTSSII